MTSANRVSFPTVHSMAQYTFDQGGLYIPNVTRFHETCKRNPTSVHKKSTARPAPVFTKLANAQHHHAQIYRFSSNAITVKSMDINSFTSQRKVRFWQRRFSSNSYLLSNTLLKAPVPKCNQEGRILQKILAEDSFKPLCMDFTGPIFTKIVTAHRQCMKTYFV